MTGLSLGTQLGAASPAPSVALALGPPAHSARPLTLPLADSMGAWARANWQREVEMRIEHFAITTNLNKQRAPVLQHVYPVCFHLIQLQCWPPRSGVIHENLGEEAVRPDTPCSHFHSRASGRCGEMGSYPWYFVYQNKQTKPPGLEDAPFLYHLARVQLTFHMEMKIGH